MSDAQRDLVEWANAQFERATPAILTRMKNLGSDCKNGVKLIKLVQVQFRMDKKEKNIK